MELKDHRPSRYDVDPKTGLVSPRQEGRPTSKARPWCCPHDVPADESCAPCGRTGIRDAMREAGIAVVEATDVITVDQVLQAARLDVEYLRGCCHGIATGTVLGALVVGALCYFLG